MIACKDKAKEKSNLNKLSYIFQACNEKPKTNEKQSIFVYFPRNSETHFFSVRLINKKC